MNEYNLKDLILLNPHSLQRNCINETGNKYGSLIVLGPTRLPQYSKVRWVCQCSCGRIILATGSDLRKNKITSCGHKCDKIPDLTNQIFGYLQVLELDPTPANEFKDKCYHWKCKCLLCGTIKSISGKRLKTGLTISCGCIKSKGELKIRQILNENNIPFECEKMFSTCRFDNNTYAKFDFYVNNEYLIEYDGEQHYKETYWHHDYPLEKRQQYDHLKNEWCLNNHIPLIRIPYYKYETLTINDLLLQTSEYIIGDYK